jgi:hypothetical protein
MLMSSVPLMAQSSLAIGLRGGGQMWLPTAADESTAVKGTFGGAGLLDLRYAYYATVAPDFQMGLNVGVDAGYGVAGLKGTNSGTFTNTDYLGNTMEYTTSVSFVQTESFVRAGASLMLAMRAKGIVVNIGPRVMMPFAVSPKLTVSEANIEAYYPAFNVTVTNELITGVLETPSQLPITNYQLPISLLMGAEIGYEFPLGKNALGIQAFADVAVWSPKSQITNDKSQISNLKYPMLTVSPITGSAPAEVSVQGVNERVSSRRMIVFGLRVYYAFTVDKKATDTTRPARDTRDHHNRYWGFK